MIRYDSTQRSTLVICSCGARDVLWSRAAARRWVQAHMDVCTNDQAVRARQLAAMRAAGSRARFR